MYLIDSHCHLNFPGLIDRLPEVLENASREQIDRMLCIATTWENIDQVLTLAKDHRSLYAAVGVHPNTTEGHEPSVEELAATASNPLAVAVGETGLDYHWNSGDLSWQHERFQRHIEVARKVQKPLIIHTRAAAEDTMQTLEQHDAQRAGGVMHCFAEDWSIARRALDIGFYISFSGIVTFKSAPLVQEVARKAPLERILVETDSPYLAPVPKRGKPNEPAYVKHTAQFVADLRGMTLDKLAEVTTDNFFRLFTAAAEQENKR